MKNIQDLEQIRKLRTLSPEEITSKKIVDTLVADWLKACKEAWPDGLPIETFEKNDPNKPFPYKKVEMGGNNLTIHFKNRIEHRQLIKKNTVFYWEQINNPYISKCDLLVTSLPPEKDTLDTLPGNNKEAYVFSQNQLFYINKNTKTVILFNLSQENFPDLQQKLRTEMYLKDNDLNRREKENAWIVELPLVCVAMIVATTGCKLLSMSSRPNEQQLDKLSGDIKPAYVLVKNKVLYYVDPFSSNLVLITEDEEKIEKFTKALDLNEIPMQKNEFDVGLFIKDLSTKELERVTTITGFEYFTKDKSIIEHRLNINDPYLPEDKKIKSLFENIKKGPPDIKKQQKSAAIARKEQLKLFSLPPKSSLFFSDNLDKKSNSELKRNRSEAELENKSLDVRLNLGLSPKDNKVTSNKFKKLFDSDDEDVKSTEKLIQPSLKGIIAEIKPVAPKKNEQETPENESGEKIKMGQKTK